MPINLAQQPKDLGKTLAEWQFPEFVKYKRSRSWYITAGIVVALLLIYSAVTANILFAMIIVIASIIFIINQKREPKMVSFKITEEGIVVDETLYEWPEIKNFWIIYEPPKVKNLYFEFKSLLLPRLPIPLQDQDPVKIREILLDHIDEDIDREGEPISDGISRALKL